MGLTSSLYTGLSGLTANSQLISVTGNNIANVNTAGFKSSRISFETQILQQLSAGSAPSGNLGGTNPTQIGLGVRLGSITRNFTNGNITPTGVNTDLAIEGNGFFVLDFGTTMRFSRTGAFTLDRDFNLVNPTGGKVQGFGIDGDFNIVEGVIGDINIPIGVLTLAEATGEVRIGGNLNAGGDAATQGAIIESAPLYSDALGTTPAVAGDDLVGLYDAGGTALFSAGDVITVSGATKGSATLATHTFEVLGPGGTPSGVADASGQTLQDFMDLLRDILGIDTGVSGGLAVNGLGQLVITGNTGEVNDLVLESGNVVVNAGVSPEQPLSFSKSQSADGESVRTTFVVYDSLGNPMTVDLGLVLEDKGTTGTEWRFYVQSEDDSRLSRVLGWGTLEFDTSGRLASVSGEAFTVMRLGTGAASPQSIRLEFTADNGTLSALRDRTSQVSSLSQDGSPIGTLQDFSVGGDGTITGVFSNSLLRPLGRVVLATFTNPQGLVENGANLFSESVNSGSAQVFSPGSGGAGRIVGSALELSNVELSQEFINLITASTGFSASSRVLTTSDRLLQELLASVR